MSPLAALSDDNAREGALNKLSPALGAGKRTWPSFEAAEAVTTKCLGGARFCSGRLRGRAFRGTSEPRAERGAKTVKRAFARYRNVP
jgi:hypothetical protein